MTTVDCCNPQVDPYVYEPNPDRPGYLKLVRVKSVSEVLAELKAIVGEYPDGGEEYFTASIHNSNEWPADVHRLVVYAVNGSNEGDYVHIDAVTPAGHVGLFLAKTFNGRDAAWAFARQLADLLGA